ncbi:MAG: hypothetical protein A2073_01275 [Deltaproteobacteria bacterium GWC2_42_11]|nr:MAG: hypothetical protein A2073_01275 [Deltaproteobacteria bacterium GWC2_42_11]
MTLCIKIYQEINLDNPNNIVSEVINSFTSRLSHDEALSLAVQRLMDYCKYNTCAIITVDRKGCPIIRIARGLSNDYIKSFYAGCDTDIMNDIMKTGKEVLITKSHPMFNKSGYRFEHDYKVLFAVPLSIHGKTIGIMYMDTNSDALFSKEEMKIFTDIANLCTLIIDNKVNLEELHILDNMTGTYTYNYFYEELRKEMKRASRSNRPLAILIASIGHIKEYNSVYGHLAGDAAIKAISEIVRSSLRDTDTASRYAARFAVLFPDTGSDGAKKVAERICSDLNESSVFKDKQPSLTLRIGIASFPENGEDEDTLVSTAEKNLFESKRKGGTSITA